MIFLCKASNKFGFITQMVLICIFLCFLNFFIEFFKLNKKHIIKRKCIKFLLKWLD